MLLHFLSHKFFTETIKCYNTSQYSKFFNGGIHVLRDVCKPKESNLNFILQPQGKKITLVFKSTLQKQCHLLPLGFGCVRV